jgi:2-polyprenyl-6-methoxyphenol hydroxylase-like FAD-dependent oxidoreductase
MSKLSSILCIGGGPEGLYFALIMKKLNPATRVTVVERNRPFDTFDLGVVFSDQTLGNAAGIKTITVGAISKADHAWAQDEAAPLHSRAVTWPHPYQSGREQLYRETARQRQTPSQRQPPAVVIALGVNGEAR